MSNPKFEMIENNVKIILSVMEISESNLLEDELIIYNLLKDEVELDESSGFNKSKTLRIINSLLYKNIVIKLGRGPRTTYTYNHWAGVTNKSLQIFGNRGFETFLF